MKHLLNLPHKKHHSRQLRLEHIRCLAHWTCITYTTTRNEVERINKPVIFLAEGVFPYFSTASLRPMMTALAARFPSGKLVLDATGPLLTRLHNLSGSVLKRSGVRMQWDAKTMEELEIWELQLLDRWYSYDKLEPRLGASNLICFIPALAKGIGIFHYRLARK